MGEWHPTDWWHHVHDGIWSLRLFWGAGRGQLPRTLFSLLLLFAALGQPGLAGTGWAANPTAAELGSRTVVVGATSGVMMVRLRHDAHLDFRAAAPGEGGVELRSSAKAFAVVLSDAAAQRVLVVGGDAGNCRGGICPLPIITPYGFVTEPKTATILIPAGLYQLRLVSSGGAVTAVLPLAGAQRGQVRLTPRGVAHALSSSLPNQLPGATPAFSGGAARDVGQRGIMFSLLTIRGQAAAGGDIGFCYARGSVPQSAFLPGCPGAQPGSITDLNGFVLLTPYKISSSFLLTSQQGVTSAGWWYIGASIPTSVSATTQWISL